MNSDYILKGKGQIALHQPDWARFSPNSGVNSSGSPSSAARSSGSPLPTKAPTLETETDNAQETTKTRFNNFTHSGSKKSVGPDVDTVDYTFEDFLDTINPLQQIPVVNMIYRHLSGDKISGVAQVMGSALFWGPTGIITGAIDAIFEQEKGGDMGETIMAGILGTETPNARNLPSNNPIKNAPNTMLADAGDSVDEDPAPVAMAAAHAAGPAHHKLAAKQPFGGVMGSEKPASYVATNSAEPAANDDIAQTPSDEDQAGKPAPNSPAPNSPAPNSVATPPVQHAPIEAEGRKLYSLAGVIRHVGSPATMPHHDVPDVRLKSANKTPAPSKADILKQDPAMMLGLQNPTGSIAAAPSLNDDDMSATRLPHPGFSAPLDMNSLDMGSTPSGNPIPAQLIQDMMMMNMQKYQNDMQNGRLRGGSLDVNG